MSKDLVGEDRVGTFALKIDTLCLFLKQYSSTTHKKDSEAAREFFFFTYLNDQFLSLIELGAHCQAFVPAFLCPGK